MTMSVVVYMKAFEKNSVLTIVVMNNFAGTSLRAVGRALMRDTGACDMID